MDCSNCANYEPKQAQEPEYHPGRIFAEDLQLGMVIRRHGTAHERKLAVIIGEPDGAFVRTLQLLAGYEPDEQDLALVASGLKSLDRTSWCGDKHHEAGWWQEGAWCEEVK